MLSLIESDAPLHIDINAGRREAKRFNDVMDLAHAMLYEGKIERVTPTRVDVVGENSRRHAFVAANPAYLDSIIEDAEEMLRQLARRVA